MKAWSPVDPAEEVVLTFDLTDDQRLASDETISATDVAISVRKGTDASPQNVITGAAQAVGKLVLWRKRRDAGVAGVDYEVRLRIDTSTTQRLVVVGLLPVRTATP